MRRLLSKTEQRKLSIVEFLNKSNKYANISDLAEGFNTSERNLRENLNELRELSNIIDVDLHHDRVQINFHKNTGMESLTRHFINNNFSFQMLELLFFNNDMSVDDLSEHLFVSQSTLYRYFNKIDSILTSQFNLSFETNPCRIEGDEKEIRNFYNTFFREKYGIFEWPFEDVVPRNLSHQLIDDTLKILDLDFDFSFRRHMRFISAIAITRYKQGKSLDRTDDNTKFEVIEQLEEGLNIDDYSTALDLKIDQHLIYEIFTPFLNDNVLYTPDELINYAHSNQMVSTSYFKVLSICRNMSKKYNVPIPNQDQLIMGIHSTYYLGSSEPFSHYLVFDKKQQFLDNVKLEFPTFYSDLQSNVKEFLEDYSMFDNDILNHMIYTFMTHWEDLFVHLRKTKPKYDVFFMSNNDYEHAKMLSSIISDEFHSQLNVYIGHDISQIKDICPSGKYDLVVTNFPYENIYKTPVICVENYPTPKDMLTIRNELVMISTEKQA